MKVLDVLGSAVSNPAIAGVHTREVEIVIRAYRNVMNDVAVMQQALNNGGLTDVSKTLIIAQSIDRIVQIYATLSDAPLDPYNVAY